MSQAGDSLAGLQLDALENNVTIAISYLRIDQHSA